MNTVAELAIAAEELKDLLVSHATGNGGTDREYRPLRKLLLADTRTRDRLPDFVRSSRTLFEFWDFIKHKFKTYQERRMFLSEAFNPLIDSLEDQSRSPVTETPSAVLVRLDWEQVQEAWKKAMDRKVADPEGAVTAARALLESTCKHILDEAQVDYDPKADLPALYKLVATRLNLSPRQHAEQVFKQILGGCTSVVEGLGAVRNRLGDAHGTGKKAVKPAPRHAELAVNLAGTMATFLAATWESARSRPATEPKARH